MSAAPDCVRKHYGPLLAQTLQNALAHVIGEQFPRIGGPRIRERCAQMLLEGVSAHLRPVEHLRHGQALWLGIATDDPPRWRQRTQDTTWVPVVLDLSTPEDIHARLDRTPAPQRLRIKALRLCEQAHRQGALLSSSDLWELMGRDGGTISHVWVRHEKKTGKLVPRRATLHEGGTGLTHKRIICWKRCAEGKSADLVAKETYPSLEAADRYLAQFDGVRHGRRQGMSPEKTAFTLDCSVALVREYLAMEQELEVQP